MNNMQIPIKINILSNEEENIIKRLSYDRFQYGELFNKCYIVMTPHSRVARSETKVFRTKFFMPFPSKNYILKISDRSLIDTEYNRWKRYVKDFLNTGIIQKEIGKNRGAILYEHASGHSQIDMDNSTELKDILFAENISIKEKIEIIDLIYNIETINWDQGASYIKEPKSFYEEYSQYLRGRVSDKKICQFLQNQSDKKEITILNRSLTNPLFFIDDSIQLHIERKFYVKHLHGDLHPRNIIVDSQYRPHLIDFEWAHRGHAFKDYILLECSIKFFYLKTNHDLEKIIEFENNLLKFNKFESIKSTIIENWDNELIEAYILIKQIRKYAQNFCEDTNWEKEYLSALFLITYGLLKYSECNFIYALYSLRALSNFLVI